MKDNKKLIDESQDKNNISLNQEKGESNSCLIYEQLEQANEIDDEQGKDLLEGVEKIAQKENALTEPNENENGSQKRQIKKNNKIKNLLI